MKSLSETTYDIVSGYWDAHCSGIPENIKNHIINIVSTDSTTVDACRPSRMLGMPHIIVRSPSAALGMLRELLVFPEVKHMRIGPTYGYRWYHDFAANTQPSEKYDKNSQDYRSSAKVRICEIEITLHDGTKYYFGLGVCHHLPSNKECIETMEKISKFNPDQEKQKATEKVLNDFVTLCRRNVLGIHI